MDRIYTFSLCVYLLISGLALAGVVFPRWAIITAGIAGTLAGLILLIGLF